MNLTRGTHVSRHPQWCYESLSFAFSLCSFGSSLFNSMARIGKMGKSAFFPGKGNIGGYIYNEEFFFFQILSFVPDSTGTGWDIKYLVLLFVSFPPLLLL